MYLDICLSRYNCLLFVLDQIRWYKLLMLVINKIVLLPWNNNKIKIKGNVQYYLYVRSKWMRSCSSRRTISCAMSYSGCWLNRLTIARATVYEIQQLLLIKFHLSTCRKVFFFRNDNCIDRRCIWTFAYHGTIVCCLFWIKSDDTNY